MSRAYSLKLGWLRFGKRGESNRSFDGHRNEVRRKSLPPAFALSLAVVGTCALWLIIPMSVEDQPGTLNHLRWGYTPIRYGLPFFASAWLLNVAGIERWSRGLSLCKRRTLGVSMSGLLFIQFGWLFYRSAISLATLLAVMVAGLLFVAVTELAQRFAVMRNGERQGTVLAQMGHFATQNATFATRCSTEDHGGHTRDDGERRSTRLRLTLALMTLLFVCVATCGLSVRWHRGFRRHFDAYEQTKLHSVLDSGRHFVIALTNRVYPFFGSRRHNSIQQPMRFCSTDEVFELAKQGNSPVIVTRVDNHRISSRYRPCWDEMAKDQRFSELSTGTPMLRAFVVRELESLERFSPAGHEDRVQTALTNEPASN